MVYDKKVRHLITLVQNLYKHILQFLTYVLGPKVSNVGPT